MSTNISLAPFINLQFQVTALYGNYPSPPYGTHSGLDISTGQKGTAPLYSICDGIVRESEYSGVWGNYIIVEDKNGYKIRLGHMNSLPLVSVGQTIRQGQHVGYEGTTGTSTGYHVHIGVTNPSGNNINPQSYMGTNMQLYRMVYI